MGLQVAARANPGPAGHRCRAGGARVPRRRGGAREWEEWVESAPESAVTGCDRGGARHDYGVAAEAGGQMTSAFSSFQPCFTEGSGTK